MYTLKITTQYHEPLLYYSAKESGSIHKGFPQGAFKNLGNFRVGVPGVGEIRFQDIGERKLAGFSKATWGALISFQGEEIEFRYEGGGEVTLNVSDLGQAELSSNGNLIRVDLPPFAFK